MFRFFSTNSINIFEVINSFAIMQLTAKGYLNVFEEVNKLFNKVMIINIY